MAITLAFDVYGTLIDTHGVILALEKHVGESAAEFSTTWREKQLEYAFRRGLMQNYQNFAICTRDALEYTSAYYRTPINDHDKSELLDLYKKLPAFSDTEEGLAKAQSAGFRIFAFSNGSAEAVEGLMQHAGILDYFQDIISTDELNSFKPNPGVYSHFLRRSGARGSEAWLISSNPFDVIGAISAGMHAAWVKRSEMALFDPWGIEPDVTVPNLEVLAATLGQQ